MADREEGSHLDVPELLELVQTWPIMWHTDVSDIGHLTCYGAPRCIVHVMDYIDGGFDMYVPVTPSLDISSSVAALRAAACLDEDSDGGA